MNFQGLGIEGIEVGGPSIKDVVGLKNWLLPGEDTETGAQERLVNITDQVTGELLTNSANDPRITLSYLRGVPVLKQTSASNVSGVIAANANYMAWVLQAVDFTIYLPVRVDTHGSGPLIFGNGTASQAGTATEMSLFYGSDPNYRFYLRNLVSLRSGTNLTPAFGQMVVLKLVHRRVGGASMLSIYWVTATGVELKTANAVGTANTPHPEGTPFKAPFRFLANMTAVMGEFIAKQDTGVAEPVRIADELNIEKYLRGKYLS